MHRPVALVARRGTLYGPRPAAHEWRSGRVCTEAPSRPPPSSGKCSARLHGPAGCGGLPAAALREGRPPPRAAAKRSAATSQRGWRVGVPLPCTAVSGLPPLELPPGRHRWAAAAGHLRPGVVCGVSLSSPVTVVKDIKRLIARRRRRGRRHGPGRGGGFTWADGDRTSIELHVWRFRWARRMRI